MPDQKTQYYSIFYISALAIIALIAGGTHFIVDRIAVDQEVFASQINVAGRQRMLVQRTALKALELSSASPEDRPQIVEQMESTVYALERAHKALISGENLHGITLYQSDNVDTLYFEPPHNIDERIREYIALSRDITSDSITDSDSISRSVSLLLGLADNKLMDGLETVVRAYGSDAREHVLKLRSILIWMLVILLTTLVIEALLLFRPLFRRIRKQQQALNDLARTDPLTGCHNRRSFMMLSEHELERIKRSGEHSSVLMLDIDKFKNVNDTYGHSVGDDVIRKMAEVCLQTLRTADIFGRLGGEEFCAVLPGAAEEQGLQIAEKLRSALESTIVPLPEAGKLQFTASIGVAVLSPDSDSFHRVLENADTNLYAAKTSGRNRVVGPKGDAEK